MEGAEDGDGDGLVLSSFLFCWMIERDLLFEGMKLGKIEN